MDNNFSKSIFGYFNMNHRFEANMSMFLASFTSPLAARPDLPCAKTENQAN
jgi:hypothetical protein